jgi:hypothetical protein
MAAILGFVGQTSSGPVGSQNEHTIGTVTAAFVLREVGQSEAFELQGSFDFERGVGIAVDRSRSSREAVQSATDVLIFPSRLYVANSPGPVVSPKCVGKRWREIDARGAIGGRHGLRGLTAPIPFSPVDVLAGLRRKGASFVPEGVSNVHGVETTRYSVKVDNRRLGGRFALDDLDGAKLVSFDVWVDRASRLRRASWRSRTVATVFDGFGTNASSAASDSIFELELTHFGVSVRAEHPRTVDVCV